MEDIGKDPDVMIDEEETPEVEKSIQKIYFRKWKGEKIEQKDIKRSGETKQHG